MGKDGFLTPKAIANRQKSKGLQKLRWYCEMCKKQCRDENGFKCHTMSEAHQRQLLLVAERPSKFVEEFSREFKSAFLTLLKQRYPSKRVAANVVYNEYIADKEHTHMNSTEWRTLTSFVHHLGHEGLCIVDETPKGLFLQLVESDPEVLAQQALLERLDRRERDEDERQADFMKMQYEKDLELARARGLVLESQASELQREADEKIEVKFTAAPLAAKAAPALAQSAFGGEESDDDDVTAAGAQPSKRKMSAVEEIRREDERRKQRREEESRERERRKEEEESAREKESEERPWIEEGLVVRVLSKTLKDGKFYRQKGTVTATEGFVATVKLHEFKATIRIDQDMLETVLPSLDGMVRLLAGPLRGATGRLREIHTDRYCATVKITEPDMHRGKVVEDLPYEHICKLDQS
eukprot:m.237137 g.237137  ORF g.237137 m.237137 type:complete len:411 (+) comp20964_c0_seq1:39-1271(+)